VLNCARRYPVDPEVLTPASLTPSAASKLWKGRLERAIEPQLSVSYDSLIELGSSLTWRHWLLQWQLRPQARSAVLHRAAENLSDADGTIWMPLFSPMSGPDRELQRGLSILRQVKRAKGDRAAATAHEAGHLFLPHLALAPADQGSRELQPRA
jgi:hypothetical protein